MSNTIPGVTWPDGSSMGVVPWRRELSAKIMSLMLAQYGLWYDDPDKSDRNFNLIAKKAVEAAEALILSLYDKENPPQA